MSMMEQKYNDFDECVNIAIMDADRHYFLTSDTTDEPKLIKMETPLEKEAATSVTSLNEGNKSVGYLIKLNHEEGEIIIPPLNESVSPKEPVPLNETETLEMYENSEHIFEIDETQNELSSHRLNHLEKGYLIKLNLGEGEIIIPTLKESVSSKKPVPPNEPKTLEMYENNEQIFEIYETRNELYSHRLNHLETGYQIKLSHKEGEIILPTVKEHESSKKPVPLNAPKTVEIYENDEQIYEIDDEPESQDKPVFQCVLCPKTFGSKKVLSLHIKYLHGSSQALPHKELADLQENENEMEKHKGEKFRCSYCPYEAWTMGRLELHLLIHYDTGPEVCKFCKIAFQRKHHLSHHIKTNHSNNNEPAECPEIRHNGNQTQHIEAYDPSFQLSVCRRKPEIKRGSGVRKEKNGALYGALRARKTATQSPVVCQFCQTSYLNKSNLSRHMRIFHTKNYEPPTDLTQKEQRRLALKEARLARNKDHKCPHCDKVFRLGCYLIRHMEEHGQKEKQYLKLDYLKRTPPDGSVVAEDFEEQIQMFVTKPTQKILKKDEKCPNCDKVFAVNDNLIRHMEAYCEKSKEIKKLKMDYLKRIPPDGSVVTEENNREQICENGYEAEEEKEEQQHDDDVPAMTDSTYRNGPESSRPRPRIVNSATLSNIELIQQQHQQQYQQHHKKGPIQVYEDFEEQIQAVSISNLEMNVENGTISIAPELESQLAINEESEDCEFIPI